MIELLPWHDISLEQQLTVFYGKDFALALSMSRITKSILYTEEFLLANPSILLIESLFDQEQTVRVIGSNKILNLLLQLNQSYAFSKRCIAVIESSNLTNKTAEATFVKCDPLNARSRAWFINFHKKRLSLELNTNNLDWINNLDDLLFASLITKLNNEYAEQYHKYIKLFDIWSNLRLNQVTNRNVVGSLMKHFEFWARENIPSSECLAVLWAKISKEMEFIKNEIDTRNK